MNKLLSIFFYLFNYLVLCTTPFVSSKILIITHSYNRPDFIPIQEKTFKAFLKDEYEFVVFNDARTESISKKIENMCASLNIRCIRIPNSIHVGRDTPNYGCADVVQYSLDTFGFDHDGIVVVLDSDMFLIKPLNIAEYLKGYDLFGCIQHRGPCPDNTTFKVTYIWNGLVFMDMRTLPNKRTMNWDCGVINGERVDVGGHLHYYLKNNPSLRVKFYSAISTNHLPQDPAQLHQYNNDPFVAKWLHKIPRGMELHADNHFLHHYAGTNWCDYSADYLTRKSILLNNFINEITADAHQ